MGRLSNLIVAVDVEDVANEDGQTIYSYLIVAVDVKDVDNEDGQVI